MGSVPLAALPVAEVRRQRGAQAIEAATPHRPGSSQAHTGAVRTAGRIWSSDPLPRVLGREGNLRHDQVCKQCYDSFRDTRPRPPRDDWDYRWWVTRRRKDYLKEAESNEHLASLDTAAWARGRDPRDPPSSENQPLTR